MNTRPFRLHAIIPLFSLTALLPVLVGCRIGPNYQRPPVPVPPAYRGVDAASNTGLGDLRWQQVFTDPVLQELIRQARVHNPDIAIAAARLDIVRAETEGLRAAYGPDITAQANETLQRISPIGLPKNRTTGNPAGSANIFGAQATWEIDFWGKYRRANEAARANLLASQAQQQAVLASLVAQIARAYYDMRSLDEQSRLFEQSMRIEQTSLALAQQRVRQGVASLDEVQGAQQQIEQTAQQLERVRRDIAHREDEISVLTGSTPSAVPRGPSIVEQPVTPVNPGIPSTLLERRPDLREIEQSLIAANAEIGVAESAYLPNISLTAQGGQESTAFRNLLTQNADTWLLQPTVNLPIFTAGRIRAQVHLAQAQQQVLVHSYQGAVLSALRDVSDALACTQESRAEREQQQHVVDLEQGAEHLAAQRLAEGVSSASDLNQARLALLTAQIALVGSEDQRWLSVVQLFEALGGGWKSF